MSSPAFHRAHEMRYGYQHKNKKVEIVNVRCRATGMTEKPPAQKFAPPSRTEPSLPSQTVQLTFHGRQLKPLLYQRDNLRAADVFSGPAIIAEYSATTLIPPDWQARVDNYGQLLLTPKVIGARSTRFYAQNNSQSRPHPPGNI